MLEIAIIENIQRKDLNPIEEASAYKQMQDEFGMTHDQIAEKVGISRVSVTNTIRLLSLPEKVREQILNEKLTEGHARALLGIEDETSLIAAADLVEKRGLNVRETEALVRKITFGKGASTKVWKKTDAQTEIYSSMLSKKLGFTAQITRMAKGGRITIRYNSADELQDLIHKLLNEEEAA